MYISVFCYRGGVKILEGEIPPPFFFAAPGGPSPTYRPWPVPFVRPLGDVFALLARLPMGGSSCAYQGALYTFGLTGYGIDTPAHEAGPFLPAMPFFLRPATANNTNLTWFPKAKKTLASYYL